MAYIDFKFSPLSKEALAFVRIRTCRIDSVTNSTTWSASKTTTPTTNSISLEHQSQLVGGFRIYKDLNDCENNLWAAILNSHGEKEPWCIRVEIDGNNGLNPQIVFNELVIKMKVFGSLTHIATISVDNSKLDPCEPNDADCPTDPILPRMIIKE